MLLVILVPVLFGLMGFAIDLGRLYLVRGELNQAASAMALAAAGQLIGTQASLGNATTAANQTLDNTNGVANKYNFGSLVLGQTNGSFGNTVNPPVYFATVAAATGADLTAGQADGTTARHVQISLSAEAPLLFWGLLSLGQSRKTSIAAAAVAGISAPLCTACGIEPFAVSAIDPTDTVNFGFGDPTAGTVYTFVYACQGTQPPAISGGGADVSYIVLNRFDAANATLDETQQLFRIGAQGLLASTNPNPTGSPVPLGCVGINDPNESFWVSAAPSSCISVANASVEEALCGLYTRLDNTTAPLACTAVTDYADLQASYLPDTDVVTNSTSQYASYAGNGRRIITIPIVPPITAPFTGPYPVLGFRQFLIEPATDGTFFDPGDRNGRFPAQYIGSPAPVKSGYIDDRFGLACPAPVANGPGKVVLHQ